MKLAYKLTILFLLLAIVPVAIVGYLAYENGRRTIIKETQDQLVSINVLKTNEFKRWIKDSEEHIEELAQRPLLKQYAAALKKHDAPDPAYHMAKRSLREDHLKPGLKYSGFLEVFVLCPVHGHISVSTNEKQEGKYRNTNPYFIEGKTRTYVHGVYYSSSLEQPSMTVSTPIKDKQGDLVGVLVGRLDFGELSRIIGFKTSESLTEDTYLVNKFNFFITEPRFGQDYALKKAVRTEGVEAGLSGKDGVGFYKDYRGTPVIGVYKWLPEFNLCIITEIGQAEAFAPIVRLAWVIGSIAFAISIVAGILGLFFARTITRPVRQLVKGAEEIGSGNLGHRVGTTSKDEIGGLSRAFDQMAAALSDKEMQLNKYTINLETSIKELENEIAERKKLEEALRESEERFKVIFNQAAVGIAQIVSKTGQFVLLNQKYCDIIGYSNEEIVMTTFQEITHPDDLVADMEFMRQLLEGRIRNFTMEKRYFRKNGSTVWVNLTVSPMWKEGEQPNFHIAVANDITENKQAGEALRQRTEELEVVNKELEAFSYSVSHDLRSPLRAIEGFSQMVMEDYVDKLDDEGRRLFGVIQKNTQKMSQLIDDLLLFARFGKQEIRLSNINMEKLGRNVFEELKPLLSERKIQFGLNGPPSVQGDHAMIRQVLVNLLSNAIKFTRPRETASIEVGGSNHGDENIYYVKDNGVGFDMQYVNKLFGVFQRLHNSEEFEGTGVGLAIVQRIIHRHGGRVWAEGKVGEGTSFYFSLPAKK